MKKILFTIILLFTAITMNAQAIRGDVNEDGVVDIADINAIIDIMKNGASIEDVRYYFWLIDEHHLGDYISESTHTLNASIIEKAVNSSVNSCPFIDDKNYPVYQIIESKFSDFVGDVAAYLILPKKYVSRDEFDTLNYVYINNKVLTTSGFSLIVKEIGTTEYKLDVNNENDNKVGYIIIKLVDEINTGLKLKI